MSSPSNVVTLLGSTIIIIICAPQLYKYSALGVSQEFITFNHVWGALNNSFIATRNCIENKRISDTLCCSHRVEYLNVV